MKILDLKEMPITSIYSIGISKKIIKTAIIKNGTVFIKLNNILFSFKVTDIIENIEKELQVKFNKTTDPLIQSFKASEPNLSRLYIEDRDTHIEITIERKLVNYTLYTRIVKEESEE